MSFFDGIWSTVQMSTNGLDVALMLLKITSFKNPPITHHTFICLKSNIHTCLLLVIELDYPDCQISMPQKKTSFAKHQQQAKAKFCFLDETSNYADGGTSVDLTYNLEWIYYDIRKRSFNWVKTSDHVPCLKEKEVCMRYSLNVRNLSLQL